jgi:hypothetical protein
MVLKVVSLHLNISRAPSNAKPELFIIHCILAFDCYKAAGHPAAASTGPSQHVNTAAARPKKQSSNIISTVNRLTKLFSCDRNKPLSVITKVRSKPAASLNTNLQISKAL